MDNINLITSLSNMPVRAVQGILAGIKSAKQLRLLEENDDDILELTPPHWRRLIRRDFPLLEKKLNWIPSRPEEWYRVHKKYEDLQKKQDAEATAKLQAAFAAKKKESVARQTALVSVKDTWKLPPLPKDGRSAYGFRGQGPGLGGSSGSGSGGTSSTRPKDKSFLQKARREAKEHHNRHILSTPSGHLAARTSQLTRAPQSMIEQKRIERQYDPSAVAAAASAAPLIRVPRAAASKTGGDERERREREARLLAIKNGNKPTQGNVISFDDKNEDDAEEEDLFSDKIPAPRGNVISFDSEDEDEDKKEKDDLFGDRLTTYPPPTKSTPRKSSSYSSTAPNVAGAKRRQGGLLSASPGANRTEGLVTKRSPPVRNVAPLSSSIMPPSGKPARTGSSTDPRKDKASDDVGHSSRGNAVGSGGFTDQFAPKRRNSVTEHSSLGNAVGSTGSTDQAAPKRKKSLTGGVFMPKPKRPRM